MTEDEALIAALEVLRHYRTRVHVASDTHLSSSAEHGDGYPINGSCWHEIRTMVHADAMAAADRLLAWGKQHGLMSSLDIYF